MLWAEGEEAGRDHYERHRKDFPAGFTQEDYHEAIAAVVADGSSELFIDEGDGRGWQVVVVGWGVGIYWFVKFNLDGELWTAFPPDESRQYVEQPSHRMIGTVNQVVRWMPPGK